MGKYSNAIAVIREKGWIDENKLFKKVYYQFLCAGLDVDYLCGGNGESCLSCAAGDHVACKEPDFVVTHVSVADRLEAFQAGRDQNGFCKKMFFRENKAGSPALFFSGYIRDQCVIAASFFAV